MAKVFKVGDRVMMNPIDRKMLSGMRSYSGVVVGISELNPSYLKVHRDGIKKPEIWNRAFWIAETQERREPWLMKLAIF